jgi:cell division protein FtsN
MEQNKVLMIIVSVAIFFAAIVGVGVALLYPRSEDATAVADTNTGREFDPIEYVRRPERAPLEETTEDEPVIIVYGDRDDTTEGDEDDGTSRGSRVTVSPDPTSEQEADSTPADRTAAGDDETAASAASQESSVARSEPSSDVRTGTEEPARSIQQEPRPEPRRVRVTEYWIQLIASPNRDRVEQVRGMLADYSLGGRVTTRDVDGELYYRLRVGPYDNHDEAEKFLTWIRDIDAFQGAYISEEYPLRTVNG